MRTAVAPYPLRPSDQNGSEIKKTRVLTIEGTPLSTKYGTCPKIAWMIERPVKAPTKDQNHTIYGGWTGGGVSR